MCIFFSSWALCWFISYAPDWMKVWAILSMKIFLLWAMISIMLYESFTVWCVPFLYSKLLIYWWGTWYSPMWWLYDIWCALDMLCDLSRCYVVYVINAAGSFMGIKSCKPYWLCDLVCAIRFTTCYSCMPFTHDTFLW